MKKVLFVTLGVCLPAIFMFLVSSALADEKVPANQNAIQLSTPKDSLQLKDRLIFEWPKEGKWKGGYDQGTKNTRMQFYYPAGQSESGWTEMGSIEYTTDLSVDDLAGRARFVFIGTQKGCPDAKWNIIARGFKREDTQEYPYIAFKIDCPMFASKEPGQVQLWEFIRGKTGIYTIQYSYKGTEIPVEKGQPIIKAMQDARVESEK